MPLYDDPLGSGSLSCVDTLYNSWENIVYDNDNQVQ